MTKLTISLSKDEHYNQMEDKQGFNELMELNFAGLPDFPKFLQRG